MDFVFTEIMKQVCYPSINQSSGGKYCPDGWFFLIGRAWFRYRPNSCLEGSWGAGVSSIPTQATLQMAAGIAGALAGRGWKGDHERSWRFLTHFVINYFDGWLQSGMNARLSFLWRSLTPCEQRGPWSWWCCCCWWGWPTIWWMVEHLVITAMTPMTMRISSFSWDAGTTVLESLWRLEEMLIESEYYWEASRWHMGTWEVW